MRHALIPVSVIHPNPHRDFKRNPVREDQVEKLIESIGRTGFWDNVVVRPHPDRKGEYQLAYGHNRLEAIKRSDIAEVRLPVADLNDWDMYQAMRDENETQQEVTPRIAFENVEVGVELLEIAFDAIGPDGTWEDFNQALGRVVRTRTTRDDGGGFEQARNHWFKEGTIGRRFIEEVVEPRRLHKDTINTVLQSHYAEKIEQAKRKKEEAKRKEAEAKKAQAQAAKDEAEADRLRKEAEEKEREAEALAAEAKRIGAGTISQEILLSFENQRQMTDFVAAVKAAGIPKKHHKAAMEHVKEEEAYGKKMGRTLNLWWYEVSGEAKRDRERRQKEEAFKRFRRQVKGGDFHAYLIDLTKKVRSLTHDVKIANTAAAVYEHQKHRDSARKDCEALQAELAQLIENLTGPAAALDVEDNGRVGTPLLS